MAVPTFSAKMVAVYLVCRYRLKHGFFYIIHNFTNGVNMPTPLAMLAGFGIGKALDYLATEKQQDNYEQNQRNQQQFTRQMAVDATPLAALGMKKRG